jgi:hypothetical protein
VKKVVKNRRFLVIFSNKTRYCSLDFLDRGTKVKERKKLFGLGGVRTRNSENYQDKGDAQNLSCWHKIKLNCILDYNQ